MTTPTRPGCEPGTVLTAAADLDALGERITYARLLTAAGIDGTPSTQKAKLGKAVSALLADGLLTASWDRSGQVAHRVFELTEAGRVRSAGRARPCAWCGQPLAYDRSKCARYCTPDHAIKGRNARRAGLGPVPDFTDPACAQASRHGLTADAWHATDEPTRLAALAVCAQCPELAACRAWALEHAPGDGDEILGGMTVAQRRTRRAVA